MTHPEEERYTESEGIPVTRKASGEETKDVQEASDEGETEVDEVLVKFINRRKFQKISFQLGVFKSYEEMK